MSDALLIYPHQLFAEHPGLDKNRPVYLLEEQLFFRDFRYPARMHKQKLVLHRAGMKAFERELAERGFDVRYLEHRASKHMDDLFDRLRRDGVDEIVAADPVDYMAEKRLRREADKRSIGLKLLESPNFLCPEQEFRNFFHKRSGYRQTSFYIHERKRLKVLLEDGGPKGGKWSFDPENRKPMRRGLDVPEPPAAPETDEVREAKVHVEKNYPDHPGSLEGFSWPVTRQQALARLHGFCEERLPRFGDYQDAISREHGAMFHSLVSSSLNIGLLGPREVLEAVMESGRKRRLPLNAREGFLRQVMGWREFVRALYVLEGVKQRNSNFFGCDNPMPEAFYHGTTGVEPVDNTIRRLLATGYAHHIERLMVLGNFMLLCEIDPAEVYTWFMELFIDSYDWVMAPNVYGMSQFADGGLMVSKPYVSSGNYLLKMSDYPRGDWRHIWDGLFWRFLDKRRGYFTTNPRTRLMASHLERMDAGTLRDHVRRAEAFLEKLF